MKILWLSEFPPVRRQIDAICEKFGITERDIVHDANRFRDAEEIITRFRESGCDELVFFSSWSAIGRLCVLGVHPYFPVTELVMARDRERADFSVGRRPDQRFFHHVKFARVRDVIMNFVEGDEF
jgi:hypothetical protein